MNGARNAHVRLEFALCSRCICLIHVVTCCPHLVPSFTLPFSLLVKKKGLVRACVRSHVKVGLLKTLGFVLCRVFAAHPVLSPAGVKRKTESYSQCSNGLGLF